jgi:hypothetical protein
MGKVEFALAGTKLEDLRKKWEAGLKVVDELRIDENTLIVVLYGRDGYSVHTYLNCTGGNRPGWSTSVDADCESPSVAFKALFRRLR